MFFEKDHFIPLNMVEVLTSSDFLSNIGGIMGLIAGMSVISIIEFFYHFVQSFRPKSNKVTLMVMINNPWQIKLMNKDHALYQLSTYFTEYIKITDISGCFYMKDKTQTKYGRLFWTLIVILSMLLSCVLIVDIYQHAEKSPVAIGIDTKIWTQEEVKTRKFSQYISRLLSFQIEFPSVLFCVSLDPEIYITDRNCISNLVCEDVNLYEA